MCAHVCAPNPECHRVIAFLVFVQLLHRSSENTEPHGQTSKDTDKRGRRSCTAITFFLSAGFPPGVRQMTRGVPPMGPQRRVTRARPFICHADGSPRVLSPARQQLHFAGGSPPDVQPQRDPATPLRGSRQPLPASGATQRQYKFERNHHLGNGHVCSSKPHRTHHCLSADFLSK